MFLKLCHNLSMPEWCLKCIHQTAWE